MTMHVDPSVREAAFSCPHCGAFTTQHWLNLLARREPEDSPLPVLPVAGQREAWENDKNIRPDEKKMLLKWVDDCSAGNPFFEIQQQWQSSNIKVENAHLSECYHCKKITVWVHKSIVHPTVRRGPIPTPDLPSEIQADFDEARSIVNLSPRGAAALLRLALQKLCKHLGGSGEDINRDIGELVKKGLNPLVQQALDIVRVVGNESVHPGTLDMRDDQDTATQLFGLINAIAEQMLTHPKSVQALYAKLPANKLAGIAARDAKAGGIP